MRMTRGLLMLFGMWSAQAALAQGDAAVYFIAPADGASLKSPVHVLFGLRPPWGVAPAGTQVPNTGHHHLLVDAPVPDLAQPVPKDAQHLHFGGGQTETTLELPPGQHTLQLLLGDYAHIPHLPPLMSAPITITVEPN